MSKTHGPRPMKDIMERLQQRRDEADLLAAAALGITAKAYRQEHQAIADAQLQAERAAFKLRQLQFRIPQALHHMSLENYHPAQASQVSAQQRIKDWLVEYDGYCKGSRLGPVPSLGLVICGPPGVGKTHLAAAAIHECIELGTSAGFIDMTDFLADLRASFDGAEPRMSMETALRMPVLAIDDLAAERPTEWAMEQTYRLLNSRMTEGRPSIITTNLNVSEITRRADEAPSMMDKRIYSRLFEIAGGHFVSIIGSDYRRRRR